MTTEKTIPDWPVAAAAGAAHSLLAENLEVDGDVSSVGPIEVMGKVTGTVRAPDVVISATGQIVGNVSALNLSVQGIVDGTIAAKSVAFSGSARVQAEITHDKITIETGAQVEGKLKRRI
ncbi:MAG: polymer-forming cytoskeletal protein [Rhodobacteraceae bacterium]|nr:polymer-forming cytoskeletal protein [Paracoccaceae bacterium]